jgi:ATP-dependent DNA helicase RecQ
LESTTNPHSSLLSGDFLVTRKLSPKKNTLCRNKRYQVLGLEDFFLDYAGIRREDHPSRHALRTVNTGDTLIIRKKNDHLELENSEGVSVARLSKSAQLEWDARLDLIQEIRVVALVRRYVEDVADKDYRSRCHGESWEVPIVEFVY